MHPSRILHRRDFCGALLGGALAGSAVLAQAQAYPSKPIRILVPFTPGGSADLLARSIGTELGHSLSQPVVVENVPGAGGTIATDRAARSAADGYTLFMGHTGTLAVNPSLYPKLNLRPTHDFAPVAWVARVPNVLVVHPSVPARSLQELVALLKSKPGALSYGSGGNGSAAHITMEYLKLQTGTSALHIPYRGTAPSINDLLAGQVQMLFTGAPALLPFIKSGKMRALAVSSDKRLAALPDVPTVAQTGVPGTAGFEADQWYGLVAPAGTPPDIVARLNQQINASLSSQEVAKRMASEGAEPTPTTPQAFAQLIDKEVLRWTDVVKKAKVTVD
ncbi:tripartite tricarboxylate transporter substrate binding protein [Xylophilus rhododendri]|uniref:Tripartite tricarboxylate transporter substrate binding protein n=1 Tax=Xylophilus rhododendri TaxID=2697032 RepID=A0A857J6P9_9BURK|nr:tripartite tricarboxylate transporter substrate binding protein [Xylophilus rhododendri]QHI98468.1 tripartite tricarboxylate transporter substrate binding protein [Xylophilus rhododendri]